MAALIEHLVCWLAGGGLVERKEEHAALGAEVLLLARRMPSRGESFWRKHDPFAARLGDGIAAMCFRGSTSRTRKATVAANTGKTGNRHAGKFARLVLPSREGEAVTSHVAYESVAMTRSIISWQRS